MKDKRDGRTGVDQKRQKNRQQNATSDLRLWKEEENSCKGQYGDSWETVNMSYILTNTN